MLNSWKRWETDFPLALSEGAKTWRQGLPPWLSGKKINPPAMQEMQETQVRSLGQEDPLEEEMAIHSSILAWKIPWTEEPGGLQSKGFQRVRHDWVWAWTRKDLLTLIGSMKWILDVWPLELWDNTFLLFRATKFMKMYYNKHKKSI